MLPETDQQRLDRLKDWLTKAPQDKDGFIPVWLVDVYWLITRETISPADKEELQRFRRERLNAFEERRKKVIAEAERDDLRARLAKYEPNPEAEQYRAHYVSKQDNE